MDVDRRAEVHRLRGQGLSQREIAQRVGISQSSVWEALRSPAPITPPTEKPKTRLDRIAELVADIERHETTIARLDEQHDRELVRLKTAEHEHASLSGWPATAIYNTKYGGGFPDDRPVMTNPAQFAR